MWILEFPGNHRQEMTREISRFVDFLRLCLYQATRRTHACRPSSMEKKQGVLTSNKIYYHHAKANFKKPEIFFQKKIGDMQHFCIFANSKEVVQIRSHAFSSPCRQPNDTWHIQLTRHLGELIPTSVMTRWWDVSGSYRNGRETYIQSWTCHQVIGKAKFKFIH